MEFSNKTLQKKFHLLNWKEEMHCLMQSLTQLSNKLNSNCLIVLRCNNFRIQFVEFSVEIFSLQSFVPKMKSLKKFFAKKFKSKQSKKEEELNSELRARENFVRQSLRHVQNTIIF